MVTILLDESFFANENSSLEFIFTNVEKIIIHVFKSFKLNIIARKLFIDDDMTSL